MSDWFTGTATIFTGFVALLTYLIGRSTKKKDAAKIILQEIRRAENIIGEYKEYRQYKFTKKIIAINSWAKNIHYFVKELENDDRDKISNLYSTGEYLDSVIAKIDDYKFKKGAKEQDKLHEQIQTFLNPPSFTDTRQTPVMPGLQISPTLLQSPLVVKVEVPAFWQTLFDEISLNYEPIYNSNVCQRLKDITNRRIVF
jgi:hypothetical protein